MSLRSKRFFFFLVSCLTYVAINAQTLYWIGGSGNFKDTLHWSHTPNGIPANKIPNAATDVVFGESNTFANTYITVDRNFELNSIKVASYQKFHLINGTATGRLILKKGFENPQDNKNFNSDVTLELSNNGAVEGTIKTGFLKLNTNIIISSGKWRVNQVNLNAAHGLYVSNSKVIFNNCFVEVGHLDMYNCGQLDFDQCVFKVVNEAKIKNCNQYSFRKTHLNGKLHDDKVNNEPLESFAGKKGSPNQINSICMADPIINKPTCSPGCDGSVIITLPPANCYTPTAVLPYQVTVTNFGCLGNPAGLTNVGPGTYTLTGFCYCTYGLYVDDDAGNSLEIFQLPVPNPVILTTANGIVPIDCPGACTGAFNLNNFFGTPPYQFTVVPVGAPSYPASSASGSLNIANLCAGTVTVFIADQNQCSSTYMRTFNAPPALNTNSVLTTLNCFGDCNGALTFSASGGTQPYVINFNPGSTFTVGPGATVGTSGLCAGVVSATLTDFKSCTVTASANLIAPTALSVSVNQTSLACNGICNGSATITLSGGTPNYNYTVIPTTGPSVIGTAVSAVIMNSLCAGVYTLNARDNNTCTISRTFTITQPPGVTVTPTFTNITCNGDCNGAISIAASGGNGAPYTFTWVPVGPFAGANTPSIVNVCANPYTVNVRDGSFCTASVVVTLTQPAPLTLVTATQALSCFGSCNGSGTVTASGGNTGGYTYSWTPNPPSGQGTPIITNLCGGISYVVTVRDVSLCTQQATVSILQAPSFTPNITTTSITCHGLCTGAINAAPTGTTPFNYTLTVPGFTVTTNPPYTNLCAGIYTLYMQNTATGCVQGFTANVAQPNTLTGSINASNITCFNGCNGSVASVVSGGIAPYTVSWVTPAGTFTANSLINQCAGNYLMQITDANGCVNNTITVTLTQPTQLVVNINSTPATCAGNCDGVLSASVSGATPPYTFAWSNGPISNPNNNLCPNIYSLQVTDFAGCQVSAQGTVTSPSPLTATAAVTNVNCAGGVTGSATITVGGGTPGYTYVFNTVPPGAPIATNATGLVAGLSQGNYLASITDGNGCTQGISFNITSPSLLSVTVPNIVNSCNVCTGAATVVAAGGSPGYAYSITNSVSVVGTGSTVASLCPGSYSATVTDLLGCVASQPFTVNLVVSIAVVANGAGIQCFGGNTGFAVANPTGGALPYSYTWTPVNQFSATATNLIAGTYTVLVRDNLGCEGTASVTVSQPAALNAINSQTNATCSGICNGAISVSVTGGVAPYNYGWTPAAPSSSLRTGLCAGLYSLLITDNNLCTLSVPVFTITDNPPLTGTFTSQNPSACIANNGSICVTAGGGVGPYTYSWSPGGSNATCLTGLSAGVYTVVITDFALCTRTLFPTLINPTGPALTVLTQSVNCFGGNTGGATVTATGLAPFNFTWTPALAATNTSSTSTVLGLTSGTYIIAAADNNTCITTQSIVIASAPQMTSNATITHVTCAGASNGSIVVNPTGGTPAPGGYTYAWSPGALPNASVVTGLGPGNYTVIISDQFLCSQTFTFDVTEPLPLALSTTSANIRCNGACNGTITAIASGGLGVISYSWLPVGTFTGSATATILNLCPNIYTIIASNPNCSIQTTVELTEPPVLTSTLILKDATCSNSCNAIATHSVSGGSPGYNYGWSFGPTTNSMVSGLCAGNYVASASDLNGCIITKTFVVSPPGVFSITATPSNPKCNATCDGSIATVASGAQGAINYNWSPTGSGPNPTGLCFGTYNLIAIDDSLCVTSAVVTLTNPPLLLVNGTKTDPSCASNCNGIISSTPANATGTVSYLWSPAAPNAPTISNLCQGVYVLQITDNAGCQATQSFTLSEPPQLVVNPAIIPSTCGNANGGITVNAIGGTPAYTFNWPPPVSSTNSVVTGLAAGIYTVIVTDFNNCASTVNIALSNSDGPDFVPIISTDALCNGQCNGSASVNIAGITGGLAPYTVTWLAPAPSATNPITDLCAGGYSAQVTDNNGCILFAGVTILEPAAVNLSPSFGLPSCNGTCDGSISLNPTGGVGPVFSYTWLPTGPPNSPVITNACAGTYNILIGDNGNNCVYTRTVILPSQLNIQISTTIVDNQCFGECNGSATVFNPQGGVPPYTFNWSNGQVGPVATNLCNGTHVVIVTDGNGCFNSFSVAVSAQSQMTSTLAITSPSCNLCNGASNITTSGGVAPYSYTWTTGSTAASVSNLCAGIYQVVVRDNLNCQQTETVIINNSNGITGETFSVQPLPCAGNCSGAATITAQGGNPPIAYQWVSPAVSNSVITNLCAGPYFVQMTDAQGCIRTASVSIDPVTSLSITSFIAPPGCNQSNGSINVSIAGGLMPYTVSWNPPSGSSPTLTGIAQGSYTITVTENSPNACSQSQQINVSNLAGPVLAATQSNINCFNACTGSLSLTASGSGGPFTFNWSNGSNSSSLTNLCKGVLTVTVTDNVTLCSTIQSYTITDNPQIQAGLPQITQPNCGLCNGGVNLDIFGGTPAYSYTWSTGATGPSISNLCAGIYPVNVEDALGCQVTQTIIINNSNGITGETFSVQGLPCNGTCDGSATVTALGGNGAITYNWISPTVTGSVISNLCAGNYFVQMQDAQGCIRTASVNVDAVTTLSIDVTIVQPGCSLFDGSASVLISGGTPSYAINWSTGVTNTATLSGIGQGSYTVTVTESGPNACSLSQQINVSNLNGPVIGASQNDIACFGQCTGMINAVVTGTGAPFSYNWSIGGNAPTITNLCQGVITLSVTDANNCVSIESYTINENPLLQTGLPLITEPACNRCDGVASVNVFGGTLPYTVAWSNGANSLTTGSLCAGIYEVRITDAMGCEKTEDLIINNADGITDETFVIQDEICASSCNGSITVTAIGGVAPVSYSWINPVVNAPVITNLCAGDYFVQMTDANGCIRTASATVEAIPGFTFTPVTVLPGCGQSDGSIGVTVSGGLPPYNFAWSPVTGSTSSLTNIGAGTYSLLITDGTTCSKTQVFTIISATAPAISFTQTNINCFNACTGAIDVLASGSVAPFTYSWSVNGITTPSISNLCKGVANLTVTTSNGCVNIRSFTITDNPELELSLPNIVRPNCFGDCNGAITLIPYGGVLPYTYSWQPAGSSNPIGSLCAGDYTVTITDSKGCANTSTVALNNPAAITVTTIPQNSSCSSVADGSIGITIAGGTPSYTFAWVGPAFTASTQNIQNVLSGTYTLTLLDNAGCSGDTVLTLVPTITITANAGRDTTLCAGNEIVLNGINSRGVVSYNWFLLPDNTATVSTGSTYTVPVTAGTSSFELVTVSSVPGCFDRDTVVVNAYPELIVDAGPDLIVPVFSTVVIGGNPTSFSAISLSWTPSQFLSDATAPNPIASNTLNVIYTVTAIDINGCIAADTMHLDLYPEVKIPNGFSPNGDNKNDEWIIDYIDQFPDNTVEVYNRWGEQLFHSQGYATPFNGKFRGKDLPVGTYYYIIHLNHPAYTKPYTGPLTIFR